MATPTKIFELKGEDFAKGLSHKTYFPIGGIFSGAGNFDPFEDYGYFLGSLATVVTDNSITSTPTVLTSWNNAGTAYIYSHTPTKLYQVLDGSPYTTTDVSAQITVTNPVSGATIWKGRYIYHDNVASILRSNTLPVAIGSNTTILSGFATTEYYHPMAIGADKNLYIADYGRIARCILETGTTGNSANYYQLEDYMAVRDLVNDGKYLVVIADNNASFKIGSTGARGNYRCQVLFYDVNSGRSTADYIYEFNDSYLISVKYLDGVIYIIGKENMWACNSVTPPKSIFSFDSNSTITEVPTSPFQVTQNKNSIYWCGQTNGKIYAFGSLVSGTKKVFYQPYSSTGATPSAITTNGTNFYIGTSGSNQMLGITNTGSTRDTSTFAQTSVFLPQSYTFAFVKVIMKNKLSSGGTVTCLVNSLVGNGVVSNTESKSFTAIGAKQSILFNLNVGGVSTEKVFNDFKLTIGSNQAIARVELWAFPVESYEQAV